MRHVTTLAFLATTVVTLGAAEEAGIDLSKTDSFRPYQLSTCVVSGEQIGSMGEGRSIVVGEQEVTVCCTGCFKKLAAKPEHYLSKMKRLEAEATQAEAEGEPAEQEAADAAKQSAKDAGHAGQGHNH